MIPYTVKSRVKLEFHNLALYSGQLSRKSGMILLHNVQEHLYSRSEMQAIQSPFLSQLAASKDEAWTTWCQCLNQYIVYEFNKQLDIILSLLLFHVNRIRKLMEQSLTYGITDLYFKTTVFLDQNNLNCKVVVKRRFHCIQYCQAYYIHSWITLPAEL